MSFSVPRPPPQIVYNNGDYADCQRGYIFFSDRNEMPFLWCNAARGNRGVIWLLCQDEVVVSYHPQLATVSVRAFTRCLTEQMRFYVPASLTNRLLQNPFYLPPTVRDSETAHLDDRARRGLLEDFAGGLGAGMFVGAVWDRVYEGWTGGARRAGGAGAADVEGAGPARADAMPSEEPVRDSPEKAGKASEKAGRASAATAPAAPREAELDPILKTLPSGKDAESRRMRRLMRNRLSAQASRDRRKKAIEDARRLRAAKEEEIAVLETTVLEEEKRMELLRRATSFAEKYLGKEEYARVTGQINDTVQCKSN